MYVYEYKMRDCFQQHKPVCAREAEKLSDASRPLNVAMSWMKLAYANVKHVYIQTESYGV